MTVLQDSEPKQEIASHPLLRLGAKRKIRQKNKKTMTEDTSSSETELLDRDMASKYFTVSGLIAQTGCKKEDLYLLLPKELVDNGLDACKHNPTVKSSFQFRDSSELSTLTVEDNGKGMDKDTIHRIFDYRKFSSSKFHYRLPTRGLFGHGVKFVGSLPCALAREADVPLLKPQIQICSLNREYSISASFNEQTQSPEVTIGEPRPCNFPVGTRISVSLHLPKADRTDRMQRYAKMIREYAVFNPDATLQFSASDDTMHRELDYPAVCDVRRRFSGGASIYWYSLDKFKEFLEAKDRSRKAGGKDLTIIELVQEFKGLTSDEKASDIGHEFDGKYQVKHNSQLIGRNDLIKELYQKIRLSSAKPSPDVVGEIGKKAMQKRIRQVFGPVRQFKHKPVRLNYEPKDGVVTSFVLEVAVAVLENPFGRQVLTGINRSASIENPFQHWAYNVKGKLVSLENILDKYGIDAEQNVVVVMHLACPSIEYGSEGKGKINIDPFADSLPKTLTEVCRFYSSYKIRGDRVGRQSKATQLLKLELLRRKALLNALGEVPLNERTTQQSLYYKIRNQMGGHIDIKRESFIAAIRTLCEEIGGDPSFRDKLKITAAERAQLYFRGQVIPISLESIEELATKGCDVILIEKEGVCEILIVFSNGRGVAIVNSRGFASDYAKQLLELVRRSKGHIWLLTDLDASGLLMYRNTLKGQIPRLGVDLDMLKALKISREEVEEKYEAPSKHLKALPPEDQKLVKDKRIEIDAVLAVAGPEKFWNYIEQQIQKLASKRDMNRSIDLTVKLPAELAGSINTITEFIRSAASEKQQEIVQTLKEWESGLLDVDKKEEELQSQMCDEMLKNTQVQDLARQLKVLADTIPKNPEKTSLNKLG